MLVRVEVIGRPLDLRGPTYPVGERLGLDPDNPLHAEVLRSGWVRIVEASGAPVTAPAGAAGVPGPPAPPPVATRALDAAPADRMVSRAPQHKGARRG